MNNMVEESKLNRLRYFLECYFNMSYDYSELDKLIDEYKEYENEEFIKELKEQVSLILLVNDLRYTRRFIKKYGMRTMQDEKIIWLLNHIKDNL